MAIKLGQMKSKKAKKAEKAEKIQTQQNHLQDIGLILTIQDPKILIALKQLALLKFI